VPGCLASVPLSARHCLLAFFYLHHACRAFLPFWYLRRWDGMGRGGLWWWEAGMARISVFIAANALRAAASARIGGTGTPIGMVAGDLAGGITLLLNARAGARLRRRRGKEEEYLTLLEHRGAAVGTWRNILMVYLIA